MDAGSCRVTGGPVAVAEGGDTTGLAVGFGSVWVTDGQSLVQVDASDLHVRRRTGMSADAQAVATGFGSVWVAVGADRDGLARVNPASGQLSFIHLLDSAYPDGVAVGLGSVWVSSSNRGVLMRVDPGRFAEDGLPLVIGDLGMAGDGLEGVGITAGDSGVWLPHNFDGTVSRVVVIASRMVAPRPGGPIDERAGTYRGVGLGATPSEVRRRLGLGGHWGPHEAIVPLDADFLSLSTGGSIKGEGTVPVDRRALRYPDVFLFPYPCFHIYLRCGAPVGAFDVTGPGAHTRRGVAIGQPLARARERYRLTCDIDLLPGKGAAPPLHSARPLSYSS